MAGAATRKTLDRYEIHDEIGRGGMAIVYRGYDTTLKRDVAVKVLHPHLVTHEEARARFEREARSVARLKHQSIVEIYDYAETAEGEVYIVMELVEGITLRSFLDARRQKPLVSEGAALIAREVFLALQAAHEAGVVHRDVKPENILIDHNGSIRLSDFGIAYLAGVGQMTTTGQILGSPSYMSPEHIEKPVVDARSDIFSMGILLYEMTVGQPPFVGNSPHQIIKRVVEGYYDNPLCVNPAVGHAVSSIIVRCLQSQPELRYASAADAVADLDGALRQCRIDSPADALRRCLTEPEQWEAELLPVIVATSLELGRVARKAGRLPEAMNHLNRVLAIDPANETALNAVHILSRRRRLRRSAERVGTILAIAVVVTAIAWLIVYLITPAADSRQSSAVPVRPPVPALTPVKGTATPSATPDPARRIVIVQKEEQTGDPGTTRKQTGVGAGAPVEPEGTRAVVFIPHPMSVDIVIDEKERFVYKAADRTRELSLGEHIVRFIPADPRLESLTTRFRLEAGDRPFNLGARLQWKPAVLLVRTNVDSNVAVNGQEMGRGNAPIELNVKDGPTAEVKVLVNAQGYRPVQKHVVVHAGNSTELAVSLEKEPL